MFIKVIRYLKLVQINFTIQYRNCKTIKNYLIRINKTCF